MSSPIIKFIEFQIRVRADNPALLDGLEAWLNMGLLSDEKVRQLCQQYLSEPLPLPSQTLDEIPPSLPPEQDTNVVASVPASQSRRNINLSGLPSHLFQSLKAEFSVRWLLFLGLFMVLVSSGVLVASRWQELPATGQYGVLFAYTLGFGIVTVWLGSNNHLPLTSETLKWVTLLLIPLNFWAIDGLGLLYSSPAISAIFILILTAITIFLNPRLSSREPRRILPQRLLIINQLGLSYLQLGWQLTSVPLIALYLGIIGTGIVTFYRRQHREHIRLNSRENLPLVFCLIPLAFLWWRVIFVVNLDVARVGFALGLTGGLFYLYSSVWLRRCAYLLLGAGWLVSIENQPEQALAVSGIALVIFGINLKRFWYRLDLVLVFITGLQTQWLIWRLIPEESQQKIIQLSLQITQSQDDPRVLLGLIGLISLALMLVLADWIYQSQHPKLAQFGEGLSLGFGTILTFVSLFDPVVRTLNLLITTVILIVYTIRRQPPRVFRVYLTHITALLTLASFIELSFPQLSLEMWGILSVLLTLAEWLFYTIFIRQQSQTIPDTILNSAWYIGLGLAGLSYQFFYGHSTYNSDNFCQNLTCQGLSQWGIIWLITPAALTTIANLIPQRRQLAAKLSILAVVMVQLLVFRIPGIRLIGWGVGTGLMVLNTYLLQNTISATITVGFGLTFYGFFAWETVPNVTFSGGLVLIAIALNLLWICQARLNNLSSSVASLYVTAIEAWAPILCWFQLIALTMYTVGIYWRLLNPSLLAVLATTLSMSAVIIRIFNNPNADNSEDYTSLFIYILGWEVELLIAHAFSFTENSLFNLSIANVILGLITQILGNYWQRRNRIHRLSNPWHVLPLFYGIFGAVLRSSASFDNWTGISLLILAFIFLGVGQRSPRLKPLTYIGVCGVSIAAYQLLFYNLDSPPLAETLIAFAGLGTTIVYVYRLLLPRLVRYLRLSETEIKTIAHFHWGISSCFLIASLPLTSESTPWLSLGIGIFITRYAVFQGRYNSNLREAEFWVYIGCLEAAAILFFIGDILNWEGFLIAWGGTVVSIIAYFLYFMPWESWGWQIQPWRRVAILIPVFTVILTAVIAGSNPDVSWYLSTCLTSVLYLILAQFSQKIQFTYFSVGLINFAYYHWLFSSEYDLNALAEVILPGLSILYFAQVDPYLQHSQQKLPRHWIRILAIGMICFAALLTSQGSGIVPGLIGLIAIFIGLGFRIRAFLYVGTATFLINAVNQLLILNSVYSFFKWIVGFVVGLVLIWIAANFETRREQMVTALQNWITELEEWE